MSNFALNFLQSFVHPFEEFGKDIVNTPAMLAADITDNPIAQQHIQQRTFGTTDQGQIARDILGSTAQVGLSVAAPAVGKLGTALARPLTGLAVDAAGSAGARLGDQLGVQGLDRLGGRLAGRAVQGAAQGGVIGGATGVAQTVDSSQKLNAKNLTLGFLQGAGSGAELGGVFGAGSGKGTGTFNPTQAVGGPIGTVIRALGKGVGGSSLAATGLKEHEANTLQDYADYVNGDKSLQSLTNDSRFKFIKNAHQIADKAGIDIDSGRAGDIKQRIYDHLNQRDNPLQSNFAASGETAPSGEVGNTIEGYHSSQELVKDYTDMLKQQEIGTSGGQLIPDGEGGKTRITDHSPFYREFYAEHGKAPTNADWQAEAERQLKAGQGAMGASDIYDQLTHREKGGQAVHPDTIATTAPSESVPDIQKALEKEVGPVVAEKIAPAVAATKDPNVVQNIVDNAVGEHTTAANPMTPEAYSNVFDVPQDQAKAEIQAAEDKEALKPSPSLPNPEALGRNAQNNPLLGKVDIPTVAKGSASDVHNQAHLNAETVLQHERAVGQQALDSFHQLSDRDQELMKAIETNTVDKVAKQADDPKAFKEAESAIRNYYDLRHAYDSRLGITVGYRQNYLRQILESKPIDQEAYAATGGNLTPGYTMERLNEGGDTDVASALERDIRGASYNHAKLAYKYGLAQGLPEGTLQAAEKGKVALVGNEQGAFQQLRTPYGNELFAQKDVAGEINKRALPDQATGALGTYDKANAQVKNLKLAGGGFHSLNVLGSYGGRQLAAMLQGEVSPVRAVKDFSEVLKSTLSKTQFNAKLSELQTKGRNLDFAASGLTTAMREAEGDIKSGNLGEKIPGLGQIHEAIFGRQIPMLKMLIADQRFDALKLDRNNPADLAKMREISQELNQNFGGFNRMVQGLTPNTFQKAARVFLATDYNEGQIRSLIDAVYKGGEAGRMARQVVFGKALLFGGIATGLGAVGGEFQGKSPQQVALDVIQKAVVPQADIGGYKVELPTTQIAEAAKPIEQTIAGERAGNGLLQGAQNFATNRLAGLPSEALQLLNNKNYLGQPIYGQDTHGRPIGLGSEAANVASGVLPIPAAQAAQTATGNQSVAAAIANTVGVRATPENSAANLPVAQQTYISTLQQSLANSGLSKQQQNQAVDSIVNFDAVIKQNYSARQKADTQINKDIAQGNPAKARQDAAAFNQKLYQSISQALAKTNPQYLNIQIPGSNLKTPYQFLTDNYYGYFMNLDVNNRKKTINNNPTKYGLKIGQAA